MCTGASEVTPVSASGRRSTGRARGLAGTPARAAARRPIARALVLARCTCARRDPGGAPGLVGAVCGLVVARGGRYSTGPCPPVAHGAAGMSSALGEADGAHRGTFARIHSVCIIFSVNISARVPVYHWDRIL